MITRLFQRLFRFGDIDGFIALALENFIQVLLIVTLCQNLLGFPVDLVYGRILPGVAISVLLGNLYYAWLTDQQNKQQGREDMTALPYGINIISLLGHIFLIMLPVHTAAIAQGLPEAAAVELTWQAGLVACFGSGVIKIVGVGFVKYLREYIPLAANLSALGGIALTFISMGFVLRTFAYPVVSLVPLGIILLAFFGNVRFGLSGGLLALLLGTVLAWGTGFKTWDNAHLLQSLQVLQLHAPGIWLESLAQGYRFLPEYLNVIIPLALFDFMNGLLNLESAEAAGDSYPRTPALTAHGIFTLVAALCGSCFPTTIYTGHPGWKAMGSGIGYSLLGGLFAAVISLTGAISLVAYFIPIEAGMAIFIAIGIAIVTQSFTASPAHHAPAVVVGLLPSLAAWGGLVTKDALHAAGMGTAANPFTPALIERFHQNNLFIEGAFALGQGYILVAIVLASIVVCIIEQRFLSAGVWALTAAVLSWIGLIHSYRWAVADVVGNLQWGAGSAYATGYCLLAILFLYVHWQGNKVLIPSGQATQATEMESSKSGSLI